MNCWVERAKNALKIEKNRLLNFIDVFHNSFLLYKMLSYSLSDKNMTYSELKGNKLIKKKLHKIYLV